MIKDQENCMCHNLELSELGTHGIFISTLSYC